ncbi:MAG: ParA family protein [Planctomycetota bacterium]
MTTKICIANQAAAVGKTTTTVNLAIGLARAGHASLLVDIDPRFAAWGSLIERPPGGTRWSNSYVSGCDVLAFQAEDDESLPESLQGALAGVPGDHEYEYILFDCPPTLEETTAAALALADEVLMPIRCDTYGLDGVPAFVGAVRQAIRDGNGLDFAGVLLTHYHSTNQAEEIEAEAREFFGEVVFDTPIPIDPAIEDARRSKKAVMDIAPRSRGTRSYLELCREVIER